jgi:tetratricopeptide (TPR) repeat protein
MGWFSWWPWNKRKELEKLEAEVRRNCTPAMLSLLAEKYYQHGEFNNAVECARRSLDRFPDSPRIKEMHAQIMRLHNQNSLSKLQKELEGRRATAETYARLADLYYRDMNDLNRALELANEGLTRFPQSEDLHMITGQIRYVRYQADHLAQDGLKCVEHMEEAVKVNPMNYKALATLARLFTEVGAYDRATQTCASIQRFAPDDAAATTLCTKLQGVEPLGTDLEDLFKTVGAAGGPTPESRALADAFPVEDRQARATGRLDPKTAAANITEFRRIDGVRAALVLDEQGKAIGSWAASGSSAEVAELVWNIYCTSEDSGRRMDIGSFKRGILEAPGMRMHLVEAGHHLVAVVSTKAVRDQVIRDSLNSFIDAALRG